MTAKKTVALIEDQKGIRDALCELIDSTDGYKCSAAYRSMEDALKNISFDLPDIVLSDIGLPGMNGISGIKLIKEKYPDMLVVMLTVYDDNEKIIDAICAGAGGYLLKNTPPQKLVASLDEIVAGGSPISPEIARTVIELFRQNPPPRKVDYNLTPHETRLLKMLVEGHNYKTSAAALGVSINTISFHMRHIYEKLQVHSKSEAVAKALKNRLV